MYLFVVFNIYYFLKKMIKKDEDRFIIVSLIIILLENQLKTFIKRVSFYLYTSFIAILFFI